MNHVTTDPITYIRVLSSTRDKLKNMFPGQSYPAVIDMLIQTYEEKTK